MHLACNIVAKKLVFAAFSASGSVNVATIFKTFLHCTIFLSCSVVF